MEETRLEDQPGAGAPRVKASLRRVHISPQKARLVINLIKGRQIEPAMQILEHSPKKGAKLVLKLLKSAVANARELNSRQRLEMDVDNLWVTEGWAGKGTPLRRWLPRAHGRATPLRKHYSHITVVLGEK